MASVGRGYIAKQSQTGESEPNCQSLAAARCLNGFLHSAAAISFQHRAAPKEKPQERIANSSMLSNDHS